MSEEPGSPSGATDDGEVSTIALAVIERAGDWSALRPGLEARFARAIAALSDGGTPEADHDGEVTLILADDALQRSLNRDYRGADKSTNVLAFGGLSDPEGLPPGGPAILGDIVLAYETCRAEAEAQGKPLADHALHLAVHGLLHLLGYDHDSPEAAEAMEAVERRTLALFGIPDPYELPAGQAGRAANG